MNVDEEEDNKKTCAYCYSRFDTLEDVTKHETTCEMKAAEITIDYESNQPMTGLSLLALEGTTDTTDCVAISGKSPIFTHIYEIYDALNISSIAKDSLPSGNVSHEPVLH